MRTDPVLRLVAALTAPLGVGQGKARRVRRGPTVWPEGATTPGASNALLLDRPGRRIVPGQEKAAGHKPSRASPRRRGHDG